jgi:hypothetical protein
MMKNSPMALQYLKKSNFKRGQKNQILLWQGVLVCLHRKMIPQEFYFLSSEKYRPAIFGIPIVVSCSPSTSGRGKFSR